MLGTQFVWSLSLFYGLFNFLINVEFLNPCQYGEDLGALLSIEVDENYNGVQYKDFDLAKNWKMWFGGCQRSISYGWWNVFDAWWCSKNLDTFKFLGNCLAKLMF